jgi:hypothetical protein
MEYLVTNNGLNDKSQGDYSLFSLVTPCDHESYPSNTHITLQS